MYEQAHLDNLKALIVANESTLMTGITFQGAAKTIHQITTTNLTPPTGYPYILIYSPTNRERSNLEGGSSPTVNHPRRKATYPIVIEITDQAVVSSDDDEAYETAHSNFRLFIDRLCKLIKDQTWIGTNPRAKLVRGDGDDDRVISKQNLSGTWQDTESNWWATLHTQLDFELIDECVDSSDAQLYA